MIKLWGYKLPLRSYQRGVRPLMRTIGAGTQLFDDSYVRILRFRFDSAERYRAFRERYEALKTSDCVALRDQHSSASSSGIQEIFTVDMSKFVFFARAFQRGSDYFCVFAAIRPKVTFRLLPFIQYFSIIRSRFSHIYAIAS